MKRLVFVRHGESTSNAGGITMAHADIPLTDLGKRQARILAGLLPPSPARIYCSPFVRAVSTAAPYCARTGVDPTFHDGLREFSVIDPDLLKGMTGTQRRPIAEAYWAEGNAEKRMGANAESFAEFHRRVSDTLHELGTLESGSVLFGHGIWLGLACWILQGHDHSGPRGMTKFREYQSGMPLPNCGTHILACHGNGRWEIEFDRETHERSRALLSGQQGGR